jgi:cytochrome c553
MTRAATILLALALAAGCSKKSSDNAQPAAGSAEGSGAAPAAPSGPSPTVEARNMFKTVCATCHGEDGRGDGPGAAALNPKPRNYTDKAWQASVTDDQIKKTILMGGAAVGKSPAMPAQPQLKAKPEVLDQLVRIIRTFGK